MVRINNHEAPILRELASEVPPNGIIVEIGAAWGFSAKTMAEGSLDSVVIYTIDPWTLAPQKQQPERERLFKDTTSSFGDRIRPIKAFSQDLELVDVIGENRQIDLLFIDGDHSFEACSHDYIKFGPGVVQGGFIVFHDYTILPGPKRTVDEVVIPSGLWRDEYISERFWIAKRK